MRHPKSIRISYFNSLAPAFSYASPPIFENTTPFNLKQRILRIDTCYITSKGFVQNATQVIIIKDRKVNIYRQFKTVPDEKHHLIIIQNAIVPLLL